MNKKTKIILISVTVFVALLCLTLLIYQNYKLGETMYASAKNWESMSTFTAEQIQDMEEVFNDPDIDPIDVRRNDIDYYLTSFLYCFDYDCPVVTDEVRSTLSKRMLGTYMVLFGNDHQNVRLHQAFTKPRYVELKDNFKQAVLNLNTHMSQFVSRYEEMSFLERCFTIWSLEREKLSQQVFDAMYYEPYA